MNVLRLVGNFLWPPKCVFCQTFLPITTEASACYCSACVERSRTGEPASCITCSTPLVPLAGELYCPKCDGKKVHFDGLRAPFCYDNEVRASVLRYKFRYRSAYLKTYATFLGEQFYGTPAFHDCTCICAVPGWKWDIFFASEDRAKTLAFAVREVIPLPVLSGVLVKTRKTKKQKRLTARERAANVRGAYSVAKPECVKDEVVLLLDDVCTTGSTVNECAKVLKRAGAKAVYVLTIAMRL